MVKDMRDWIFFPLMGAIMLGMIAFGLAPGKERLREAMIPFSDPEAGLYLEGDTLSLMYAADGLSLDLVTLENGRRAAQMAAFRRLDEPPLSQGIFITLPPNFADAFAGRTIRISIEARAPLQHGSPRFSVAYFGGENGNSGWRDITLSGETDTYVFDWEAPLRKSSAHGGGPAFIGVWPDPEGRGRAIDMFSLRVRIAGDEPPALRGDGRDPF